MACFTRCIIRWGLIGGLALGGATLLVGPERVASGFHQVRFHAQGVVDDFVENPLALRRQLEKLAEDYPDRIAEVQGEIAEVQHQISMIEHDVEVADRVVAMTSDDLRVLKTLVAQAEAKQASTARTVAFRFEGVRMDVEQAYTEAGRINHVRQTYQNRLGHDSQQLQFLGEQKARLVEILDSLETDFATYQAQLWQLDRQIDAIERNERLIELTKRQQETLASYDKFAEVGNLRQLEAKLAELRTVQEAQLQALSKHGIKDDYLKRAETDMGFAEIDFDPFYDLDEDTYEEDAEEAASDPIAFNG
jgi:chromosome segregation ATPase